MYGDRDHDVLRRLREHLVAAAHGRGIAMNRARVYGLGGRAAIEAELAAAEPGTPPHAALTRALAEFAELEPWLREPGHAPCGTTDRATDRR